MNKYINLTMLLLTLTFYQSVDASQTSSYYFTASCPECKCVTTNGGNVDATINCETGALSASFTPSFKMTVNNSRPKSLTLSATCQTQTGSTNAIFNIGTTKYIILTNNNVLPPNTSITNINGGTPIAANNQNAIAYSINDPTTIPGRLSATYNTTNKNWQLTLTRQGSTTTTITIPANLPLNNTYSFDDEPGPYQSTITLTFN